MLEYPLWYLYEQLISGFRKFPLKIPNFSRQKNIIGLGQKIPGSKTGQPLIYWRSKVCSGWIGSMPISRMSWDWFHLLNIHVDLLIWVIMEMNAQMRKWGWNTLTHTYEHWSLLIKIKDGCKICLWSFIRVSFITCYQIHLIT